VFRGATLYTCLDLPSKSILAERIKNGKVDNIIEDKNSGKKRNLPSIVSDVTNKRGRIVGVIQYYYQDRVSKQVSYSDIYARCTFMLSTSDNVLAILGRGSDVPDAKGIITKMIDESGDSRVQYFTNLEISPDKMYALGLRVRNSYEGNWCDRPRFSHGATKYNGNTFHDYSKGDGNCAFDAPEFQDELDHCTGFSPIIKIFKCEKLDPSISNKPKTIKFKHEGQISTSKPYDFEDWEDFIFNLVVPSITN
jgi:hypothetical protein